MFSQRGWLVGSTIGLSGFFLGALVSGGLATASGGGQNPVAAPATLPLPTASRLAANLYQHAAAEYRACCLQTYRFAGDRLEQLLTGTAPRPARPAVVMDLDETVLDNGAFQTVLNHHRLEYSDERWKQWERDGLGDVRLVPGARQFINKAIGLGATVVYISNRSEANRAGTIAALNRLELPLVSPREALLDERLLLLLKTGTSSDKSARRDAVAARFNVVMMVGDNLRDFSEAFAVPKDQRVDPKQPRAGVEAREKQVDDAACHWGFDWIILPNPVYGEWERVLSDDPLRQMVPTTMTPAPPGTLRPPAHNNP